jgi:hypothetical protein
VSQFQPLSIVTACFPNIHLTNLLTLVAEHQGSTLLIPSGSIFLKYMMYGAAEMTCYSVHRNVTGSKQNEVNEFFSICLIRPAALGEGGFTQPLTEMSTRSRKIMFLGSRARPVRRADNLTSICEPIV